MNRQNIIAFLAEVFQRPKRKSRPYRSQHGRRVSHSYRSESLEDRCLLALVGIDLGVGGSTPTNWTPYAGTGSASLTGLIDETGSTTLINVAIAVDIQPGRTSDFRPPANELPLHNQSLAGIDGAYANSGNIEFTFTGLTASALYEIYVFGGDTNPAAASNRVTISGGGTSFSFEQPHDEQQLIVNRKRGDSTLPLDSYAEFMTADASGEILVRVDNGGAQPTQFFGVAGIAIQQATLGEVRIDDLTVDEGTTVANTTHISTGSGADSIVVNRSLFSRNVLIHSRNGNDLIALLNTDFQGPVHLYAGNQDDVLGNTSGNRFAFDTGFFAGPGKDTSADDGTATYGRTGDVSSFEIEDESSLTDLIDIALSNFDDLLLH